MWPWQGGLPPGMSGGGGGIGGSTGATDNALLRADGAGGAAVQSSAITADDTGNITLPARLLGKQGADVPSDVDLTLGNGNYFIVTGTTTIHGIRGTGWTAGSVVVLQFSATVTVTHSGTPDSGDALFLAGGLDYIATSGDTLTLLRDAAVGVWREVARAII